ncbi:testis-specific gene A8 protein-like [Lolium rigidum]|uniref:testis-specific gene A8 protein-like n=1 Tax=Lolium rigidum TaxID=89674 RepID=UPI001F5DA485|nr:testis-specific gene A8 protein-like [Lolium rigidum]
MRKAKATAPAAAAKPKPRARARAKPKPKPSPASLSSGTSSPSATSDADASPSPVAIGRGFLAPASPATPNTRSPLSAPASPFSAPKPATVDDLRALAASTLDSLKRRLDALHGDSVRDLEASHSRISKRIKMQTQSCLQLAEEAEREHRKVAEKISESADEMKASYKKFVAEVQSSTSLCKVTVPEMAKSVERAIDGLRTRYNVPATAA